MAREFKLPDPGEGIHEAEIVAVNVSQGDRIQEGDPVLVVETDKAEVDVPAPSDGVVEDVRVSAGDQVEVGDVVLTYSTGEAPEGDEEKEQVGDERGDEKPTDGKPEENCEEPEQDTEEADEEAEPKAEEQPAEPDAEEEERTAERETKDEEEQRTEEPGEEDEPEPEAEKEPEPETPVPAAPSTRRLARELDVDLREVEPSGRDGRVLDEDVERAAGAAEEEREEKPKPKPKEVPPEKRASGKRLSPRTPELPEFEQWGPVERIPLRSVRRATAQRMMLAWSQIPHVTHEDIADVTELERFRREHGAEVEEKGGKLTLTVLVMKAVVGVLKEFPRFNASLDPEAGEIVLKRSYHLGVAVSTDRGLLVPVVRDVDRKTVTELAAELVRLADAARDGDIDLEEMRGGTFTVTNPGPIGGTGFTPIINFPQVAILGMARARFEQVVEGDLDDPRPEVRLCLPLCLAFDHRVNDGADAARFVAALVRSLSDPQSLVLRL